MRVVVLAAGIVTLAAGIWAFADPASFYEQLATFPPYNRHFIHDIGAFQIGTGVTLLITLRWKDAFFVVLSGSAVGTLFHFVAHLADTDLGGRASDPALIGVLVFVLTAGAVARALILQKAEASGVSPASAQE